MTQSARRTHAITTLARRTFITSWFRVFVASLVICAAVPAFAADRYAVVVTGALGTPEDGPKFNAWRSAFVGLLRETYGYPADRVVVLADEAGKGAARATRENVRSALADLHRRARKDDLVVVLLMGHGTGVDLEDAKFNLVGPDLSAQEWAALIKPIGARVVFINTTAGSFPFLQAIAGPERIVLTATDSPAQQFDTVFPELFVNAFEDAGADADKNGRVSLWEAFTFAGAGVRGWFEQRGRLATERPVLDDTGDGVGRESEDKPAPAAAAVRPARPSAIDGTLARVTYLQPEAPVTQTGDAELTQLLTRRAQVESELELLRARKDAMTPEEYEAALEKTLLELARIDRLIRSRT
jgi:hypothetical protein